jgi:peptide deformylase
VKVSGIEYLALRMRLRMSLYQIPDTEYGMRMAVLPILTGADHPMLRTRTQPVAKVTKDILKILRNMQDTVEDAEGAGLALIAGRMTPLINPEIAVQSKEMDTAEEGCLSLPGTVVAVPRHTEITITYLDAKGKRQQRKLRDFDARVVQHEVDHLEGVLIVDYL